MAEYGYFLSRRLPDRRVVAVVPLTFGRGRIIIGDDTSVQRSW